MAELEQIIKAGSLRILEPLKKRLADPDDWLEDYEMEAVISFWLRKDDPAYDEKGDNILIELGEFLKAEHWEFGMADGENHSEYQSAG